MTLLELSMFLAENSKGDLALQVLDTFYSKAETMSQFDDLASAYDKLQNYPKVKDIGLLELEIATPEEEYLIKVNLSRIYNLLNEPYKAFEMENWVLSHNPNNIDVLIEKAISLALLNKRQESNDLFHELLSTNTDKRIEIVLQNNLASYYLKRHEFRKGLKVSWDASRPTEIPKYNLPYWDMNPIPNGVLLIEAYGGYGDELINIRFMENVKALGMTPVWKTHRPDIRSIVTRMGYQAIEDVSELDSSKYTVWCVSMRLPYLLQLDEQDVNKGAYLTALPEKIEKFKQYKGCVGIKHFGEQSYEHNLHRTIPLDTLIQAIPEDKQLVSLHKEYIHSDNRNIIDLSDQLNDFEDTLGLLYNLDYVVSSCTSVPHANAALGKDTFIFVPIFEYYVWASTEGTEQIWYNNNVKLLRQQKWRSWEQPINQLKSLLGTN